MKLAMTVTPTKFGGTACLRFEAACLRFCLRTYVAVFWCDGTRKCFSPLVHSQPFVNHAVEQQLYEGNNGVPLLSLESRRAQKQLLETCENCVDCGPATVCGMLDTQTRPLWNYIHRGGRGG